VITTRETEVAKECLRKGDKQRALLALRRKKYQESLLEKTDQQLAQLQALTSDVEFALVQKDVFFGLQQGTAVLKAINKEIGGLEKVEMLMEESAEAQAYQRVFPSSILELLAHWTSDTDRCANRRSARCSQAKCRTRTKTPSRTNWRQWNVRQGCSRRCLKRRQSPMENYQMHRRTLRQKLKKSR
jgi:charged multivesicular body protein 6